MLKQQMCNESPNAEQINEEIRGLTYRPEEVMAFSGEKVTSFVPKTGKSVAEKFIVTTKTKHDMSGQYDIAVPNARKDITYPGALLVANQKLIEGVPDPPGGKTAPDESYHRSAGSDERQSCNRGTQRLHGSDRGNQ